MTSNCYVIRAVNDDKEEPFLFWSNTDGWCDRRSATVFTAAEMESHHLPIPPGEADTGVCWIPAQGNESNHTILVAFVVPGLTREHACFRMRDVLDRMYEHARDKEDNEIQMCIDETWFPNDACVNPHSSERAIWQRDVTAQDLIRAEMHKIVPTDPTEYDRKYAEVRQGEPTLTLWEDDIEHSAHAAAEQVATLAYGLRLAIMKSLNPHG